jgi:hypothetical protein
MTGFCAEQISTITALDKSLVVSSRVLGQMGTGCSTPSAVRGQLAEGQSAKTARMRQYALRVAEVVAIGMAIIRLWPNPVDMAAGMKITELLQVLTVPADAAPRPACGSRPYPVWIVPGLRRSQGSTVSHSARYSTGVTPTGGRGHLRWRSRRAAVAQEAAARARPGQFWTAAPQPAAGRPARQAGRALMPGRSPGRAAAECGYALGIERLPRWQMRRPQAGRCIVVAGIDQQWGVARTLLGLGDLARLRRDPDGARDRYLEALPILREIDSRPEIARCLAGLARIALDQGELTVARQHLADSIGLSHSTGSRIGVARGLEAFAALAVQVGQARPFSWRLQRDAARRLTRHRSPGPGPSSTSRPRGAWGTASSGCGAGAGLTSDDAVALALDARSPRRRQTGSR